MTLRKGLTRLEGVADAKLIVKPAHMEVRMKPGAWPDVPRMLQTMRDAGYKPIEDRVELTVSGKLVKQGDGLAVELDAMQSPLALPLLPVKEGPDAASLARRTGETLTLTGKWQPPADGKGPGALQVTAPPVTGPKTEK